MKLIIIIRKGYYKVVHSKGSFGYYKGQGFWKSNTEFKEEGVIE